MNKKRKRSNELIFSTLKKLASIDIQKFDKNIKTYELIEDFIQINSDLTALNDSGAIQGLKVREGDGVYITYTDDDDTVSKN